MTQRHIPTEARLQVKSHSAGQEISGFLGLFASFQKATN
jgi:hypothetical protein